MKLDPSKDAAILNIFLSLQDKLPLVNCDKVHWFRTVTAKLSSLGYNYEARGFKDTSIKPNYGYIRSKHKETVSVSNFHILEFNGLYRTAILNIFNEEDEWSHPAVLYMLFNYKHLKNYFNEVGKFDLVVKLKLFINMIPANIGLRNTSSPSVNLLTVIYNEPLYLILSECIQIMRTVVHELDVAEKVVCVDIDRILLSERILIDSDDLSKPYIGSLSPMTADTDGANPVLNEICRHYKVNITV